MRDRVHFVGGATTSRDVVGKGLAEFLLSHDSDASLLGAGSDVDCNQVGTDLYECHMPQIGMLGFQVRPVLTVRLERDCTASSLCIRVVSAHIYLVTPGSPQAQLLQGCLIDSANEVSWSAHEDGWLLATDLELRVAVELPRGFYLPRASVERTASAILRRVCAMQCKQFLLSLEHSYEVWARTQNAGRTQRQDHSPSAGASPVSLCAVSTS